VSEETSNIERRTLNVEWEHPTTNIEQPTSNGTKRVDGRYEIKKRAKISIGFWLAGVVYAASAFLGSGWGRVNGSTIFNDF